MRIDIADEKEIQKVFALRMEVFVDEQNVPPELELDEEDANAVHFIAEQQGTAVGCARLIINGNDAHIGRLAVKKSFRKQGIGGQICRFIIDYSLKNGCNYIWLNSQLRAVSFYEKLGFCSEGEIFMDAGIKHKKMVLK